MTELLKDHAFRHFLRFGRVIGGYSYDWGFRVIARESAVFLPKLRPDIFLFTRVCSCKTSRGLLYLKWLCYHTDKRKYLLEVTDIFSQIEKTVSMYRTCLLPTGLINETDAFMGDAAGE